ncbi:transmembrane anti-sigma factor [Sinorhizobium americanum CCGM7]|uniref:anti-sigma factor family protein n=1 Tax=Sinorhizobium americanum TaxID=194963 RepID=UPI0004D9E38A|nr:anti-sigma factor [Sinorhizobium americanum]APG85290.1 transmembrane anti-sigma factor [Sinorhizobium americanum CCGM7]
MQQTKGLALEVRLSAYIDGELGEAERSELDALLARDDDARVLLDKLKAGSTFGNRAFEDFLHDPVPLALVRQIKQGGGISPKLERVTTSNLPKRSVRVLPRLVAASVGLLLTGGVAGFILGSTANFVEPAGDTVASPWINEIADYHRIYSRQKDHLVEVPASQAAHIETWLTSSVGVPFTIPDLTRKGLAFEGARLLVANGKPVAQLVYRDQEGEIFAVCFVRGGNEPPTDAFSGTIRGDLGFVSWQKEGTSFVFVGPSSAAGLQDLAQTVAAVI